MAVRAYHMMAEKTPIKEIPNFDELGSRLDDLQVKQDGKLENDDDISLETYRKMRKDPQVKACLLVLKLPLLQVDWTIQADSDEGKKLAAWIESRFYDMDDSIQYYLREMLTALDFGFSVSEKVWQLKTVPVDPEADSTRTEQMIVPLKLKTYDPRSLTFVLDPTSGKLTGVIQKQKGGKEVTLPAQKLLIYSHEKEFGDYNGEAALRAAYKPWIIKEFLQRFWNIALERYGTPFMSMTMDQGGSLKKALSLMDMIKGKVGVPLPKGYELEVHSLANTGISFEQAIKYQDTQIARSMLIPDLVFGNNGDSGAYALSKTHAAFFLLRLNGISQEIGDIITKYMITDVIRYNFGEVKEFPIFKFSDVAEDDLTAFMAIVTQLITGKVIAPTESWIRERMGIPQPDDEAKEYLDKQREVVMSGMENLNKANEVIQEEEPKNKKITGLDKEKDKKEQEKIAKNAEDIFDDYIEDLKSLRKFVKIGLQAGE